MRSNRLLGKVIVITGAAQGIGRAIAQAVAEASAIVMMTDVDGAAVAASAAELRTDAYDAEARNLDVRDAAEFGVIIKEMLAKYGRVDGLVSNAGINVKYRPLEMPDDEWDRCMDVNLRGQWIGAKAVLPAMIAQGSGSIVNVSSVHGHQIIPGSFPYPVSKAGILGLTRALGVEYAPAGVRVNSISPGYVETALVTDWLAGLPDPNAARREAEALIPARRFARVEEVGLTAVFLLSDEAPYINAADIVIDGGRMSMFHA